MQDFILKAVIDQVKFQEEEDEEIVYLLSAMFVQNHSNI
jgi:hypothetical protein